MPKIRKLPIPTTSPAPSPVIRKLPGLLLTLLAVLLGLGLLLYLFQGKMIYFPVRGLDTDPSVVGLDFEEVEVETEDGIRVFAWWIPTQKSRGVVLFSPGNAPEATNVPSVLGAAESTS